MNLIGRYVGGLPSTGLNRGRAEPCVLAHQVLRFGHVVIENPKQPPTSGAIPNDPIHRGSTVAMNPDRWHPEGDKLIVKTSNEHM